jgi:hypothetical protein
MMALPVSDFASMPVGPWVEGETRGGWQHRFNGFGNTELVSDPSLGLNVLRESPGTAATANETHSALVASTRAFGDVDFSVRLRTVRQLRQGTPPNPWEVGWVLWHYTDNTHFYYFIPKPDGWELGKEDPAYRGNQRFLLSGSTRTFPLGRWYTVRILQVRDTISVFVNGTRVCSYRDRSSPYLSGSIGLYDEDAVVHFANVKGVLNPA